MSVATAIGLTFLALIGQGRPRPAAIVLDLNGAVEVRPAEGPPRAATVEGFLYPGDRLAIPADGSATVALLAIGVQEVLKAGSEATVGPKGCSPPAAVERRKPPQRAVVPALRGLKPAPGDARPTVVGFRSGADDAPAIAPALHSVVATDRPEFAWPAVEQVERYRVKLLGKLSDREIWRVETAEPRLPFPDDKPALTRGNVYVWEVTNPDFRVVATGEFTVATESELARLADLAELAADGDRADRLAAALGYRRLGAIAEALAAYERLAEEAPDVPAYRDGLAELRRQAGRKSGAPE